MKKQNLGSTAVQNPAMPFFGRRNYILILCGLVAIILGFVLLSGGGVDDPATEFSYDIFSFRRLYIAPLLILAGFVFEIYAIMYRPKAKTAANTEA